MHGRFYRLDRAKEELLQPLLQNIHYIPRRLQVVYEDDEDDEVTDEEY